MRRDFLCDDDNVMIMLDNMTIITGMNSPSSPLLLSLANRRLVLKLTNSDKHYYNSHHTPSQALLHLYLMTAMLARVLIVPVVFVRNIFVPIFVSIRG